MERLRRLVLMMIKISEEERKTQICDEEILRRNRIRELLGIYETVGVEHGV